MGNKWIKPKEKKAVSRSLKKSKDLEPTFATPPFPALFVITLRFRFFSSNPLPNILKSDLGGFVEAKKAANNINFDNRGKVRSPSSLSPDDWVAFAVLEEPLAWSSVYVRGKDNKSSGGSFALAQSAALVSLGRSDSRAVLSEELNSLLSRMRTSSVGGIIFPLGMGSESSSMSTSSPFDAFSFFSRWSSITGLTNPGQRAAAMYCNSCGLWVKGKHTSHKMATKCV